MPGEDDDDGIDIFNTHAPSGNPILTDPQRFSLFKNLLLSRSFATRGGEHQVNKLIRDSKFIFGGDMNTKEMASSQILNQLHEQGHLRVSVQIMYPLSAKAGDMCVGRLRCATTDNKRRKPRPSTRPIWHRLAQTTTAPYPTTDTVNSGDGSRGSASRRTATPAPESKHHHPTPPGRLGPRESR